jgi:hypothetical protein
VFVVFGWEKTFKPKESLLKTHCHACRNDVSWRVWEETEWVSLFFVRVLPLFTKHHIGCDVCRSLVPLDAKTCRAARGRQRLDERARSALHDDLVRRIDEQQFGGMTEGQRRYYKGSRDQGARGAGPDA